METRKQKLPIGIENFEKLRSDDFYYIDKTGFIRELLKNWGEVNLFTRPRRFGKSLNIILANVMICQIYCPYMPACARVSGKLYRTRV